MKPAFRARMRRSGKPPRHSLFAAVAMRAIVAGDRAGRSWRAIGAR
ncbi:hypothetical protein [Lysobacter solisilvae (ex Woo and Kim 2020)]|uniref:Uncharacterized protein n=1 Tax=Agrilutibacter terrestris TaxID=2865112 RepID=A0A7H0FU56_9GAMM|nr:hypothetical protein [Lysobacter terrestris]QNP39572.1 hypothetical protein H8B22_08510 [Lysobacter terrestris]